VYSHEILHGLAHQHPAERFLFCYRGHRLLQSLVARRARNAGWALLRSGGISPWRCGLFHALNQRVDARFAPTIATFHDLFVMTGDYSSPEFRGRFAQQARDAARYADLMIAVSAFTAGQVADLLGVNPAAIRVVHHGVRAPVLEPLPDEDRENLILHVGAIQKRKNLIRLVEAFETLSAGWRMVLAGPTDGFGAAEILARIDASRRRQDIEIAGYVTAADLERLFQRARVFAFPSLDEGFGMPVLDAMARGVPVLTSNRSALPEVAGDAALVVDPASTDDIAHGLHALTGRPEIRDSYRNKGIGRAAGFSWGKAVKSTWAVYRELAGSSLPD
jgi:glycosyltransferase involved in cell wall biosynthesis